MDLYQNHTCIPSPQQHLDLVSCLNTCLYHCHVVNHSGFIMSASVITSIYSVFTHIPNAWYVSPAPKHQVDRIGFGWGAYFEGFLPAMIYNSLFMKEHIRIPQTNSPKQTVVVLNYTFTFKEQRTTTFNYQHLATAALSIGPFLTMLPETLQLILGLRGFQMGVFSRWVFCFILTVVCISLCTTVDGQNPAPPRMMIIPLFIGFLTIPDGAGFRPSTVSQPYWTSKKKTTMHCCSSLQIWPRVQHL